MACNPDSYDPVRSHYEVLFEFVWDTVPRNQDNIEIISKLVMEFKHILPELAKIRIMESEIAKTKKDLKQYLGYDYGKV